MIMDIRKTDKDKVESITFAEVGGHDEGISHTMDIQGGKGIRIKDVADNTITIRFEDIPFFIEACQTAHALYLVEKNK